jgi:hypothetical protein
MEDLISILSLAEIQEVRNRCPELEEFAVDLDR